MGILQARILECRAGTQGAHRTELPPRDSAEQMHERIGKEEGGGREGELNPDSRATDCNPWHQLSDARPGMASAILRHASGGEAPGGCAALMSISCLPTFLLPEGASRKPRHLQRTFQEPSGSNCILLKAHALLGSSKCHSRERQASVGGRE